MMTTPFLTILLENGEELVKSTLEDSYRRYRSSYKNSDLAQFIRTTKIHVGRYYTLNEIINSASTKKKKNEKTILSRNNE